MYSMKLLGAVDLRAPDGRRVGSVLSQPKRLALLAMLAMESPRRLQRDEVIGRLWPDVPEERARRALRQSLYYLGRSLGPGVIAGKGAEGIGLAEGVLTCDACELMRAAADGRDEDVVAAYDGEFLPAFHLDGAPAPFEHWLEEARRRIRGTAVESAWRLADREARDGTPTAAVAAARRAWELEGRSEAALRKLLRALMAAGDDLGARAEYEAFAGTLAAEEGRAPAEATRAILDEGAPVEPAGSHATNDGSKETRPRRAPAGTRAVPVPAAGSRGRFRWGRLAAVALVAVLAAYGVWSLGSGSAGSSPPASPASVAMGPTPLHLEPVRDLRGADRSSATAESVTNELAARLVETGAYTVALGTVPDEEIALRLRSTIAAGPNGTVLSLLILDGPSQAVLDRITVAAEEGDPGTLASRATLAVRERIGDLLAWRGLAAQRIPQEALELVRTAAGELDEARRLRRTGAREAAAVGYGAVDSLLTRAGEVASDWVEPPARRAELATETVWLHLIPPDVDPVLAHREIRNGLEHAEAALAIEPGARALDVRGTLLYWAALTATDEEEQSAFFRAAERDLERAVGMDPDRPRAWDALSAMAERRGHHALAYQRARKAYTTDHALRASTDILTRLFTNALEVGDAEGAAGWCDEARHQHPDHWLGPYCDLSRLAWAGPWSPEASRPLLEQGLQRVPDHPGGRMIGDRLRLLHAVVLARAGHDAAAEEILASIRPERSGLEVLALAAWVRTALGEPGRARALLTMAMELDPEGARQMLGSRRYAGVAPYAVVRAGQ